MKKGISEYNLALLMALIVALVLLAFYLGWIKSSGENVERERNKIASQAGCLANDVCKTQDNNKACVYTYEGKNECGCRAWFGADSNADCATGKKCISPRGTNYGTCQ
ncbi:MAG: hypothetical protein HY515_02320 [Candidatus Aenigmarchaeota archaeon]|nr:hypothetical protein [Candidatus Aenigmarchaeota archaeon]